MTVILDEAANICRIADLPSQYSHAGGRGVIPVTILQSYEQGMTVWGEQGMAALWGAATKKLIGAGVDCPRLPATSPPWSGSTTSRSSRSATATAARACRSRCAARRSSKPPTSAPCSGHGTAARPRGACRADPAAALVRRPGRRQISAATRGRWTRSAARPREPPSQAAGPGRPAAASPPGRGRSDRAPSQAAGREEPPPRRCTAASRNG